MSKTSAQSDLSATRVEWLASIDSTNDEAMRRARDGERGPVWIAAWEQTKGRGRQGRVWQSPQGNLAASLLLIDPAPIEKAPQLGFVAGVALAETAAEILPSSVKAKLKWPNDLVIAGAKLSGLLLESTQLPDGHQACVVGVGLNVVKAPEGLPYAATSLHQHGAQVNAKLVLERLSAHMSLWLSRWQRGDDFAAIRAAWMKHAAGLETRIRVGQGVAEKHGIFRGIDAAGQMILETDIGRQTIAAGDVFLHAAGDQVIDGSR